MWSGLRELDLRWGFNYLLVGWLVFLIVVIAVLEWRRRKRRSDYERLEENETNLG